MKNELLDKGIILPSGEIGKDKINLVAGAITQPFAEMVWVTTGGDMETINRLTDILVTMNTPADRGKLFKIIKMLYGLMGLPFSGEAEPMDADPAVLENPWQQICLWLITAKIVIQEFCFPAKQLKERLHLKFI